MRTHYQTLKVAEDAPPEVIKAAYRALSQQHHPDSNPDGQQEEALRAMQAINTAYEALIDPEGRAAYDESLRQELAAGASGAGGTQTGGSLVPDSRGSLAIEPEQPRRRRRSSSSSRSRSSSSRTLARLHSDAPYASSSRALVKAERALAPMYSSAQSSTIYGRHMDRDERKEQRSSSDAGLGRPGSGRGLRMVWVVLIGLFLGMIMLGGLAAWKLGFTARFWAWYQRHMSEESVLSYGTENDSVALPGDDEKPYTRPSQTPLGRPWPTSTGYLSGADVLWNDGHCEITVDNTLHDSDVHVKIVALVVPEGGGPTKDGEAVPRVATTVREAFLAQRTRMTFENLRPGNYEVRYRSLSTGFIIRAARLELKEEQGPETATSIMLSLYKVARGNSQRPILEEGEF